MALGARMDSETCMDPDVCMDSGPRLVSETKNSAVSPQTDARGGLSSEENRQASSRRSSDRFRKLY